MEPKSAEAQMMMLRALKCRSKFAISCTMAVFIKDNCILEVCNILFGVIGVTGKNLP